MTHHRFVKGKLYKTAQAFWWWSSDQKQIRLEEGVVMMFVKDGNNCPHEGYHDYIFLLEDKLMTLCHNPNADVAPIAFLFWGPLVK